MVLVVLLLPALALGETVKFEDFVIWQGSVKNAAHFSFQAVAGLAWVSICFSRSMFM